MKKYREEILPIIKTSYSGLEVDFIYQVLLEANQYKTTHNNATLSKRTNNRMVETPTKGLDTFEEHDIMRTT